MDTTNLVIPERATQIRPGVGVGLRPAHTDYFLAHPQEVEWFEILIDNYMPARSVHIDLLDKITSRSTVHFHGVGMNLGGVDTLDQEYLYTLREFIDCYQPGLVSDHLCFSHYGRHYAHDLLPVPYTRQTCCFIADRIKAVQDMLGRQIAIENVSTYLQYKQSTMPEWEFINTILSQSDCLLLLDVNNLYVNAYNFNTRPSDFFSQIDNTRISEIHLAGYEEMGDYLLDSHGDRVQAPVWQCYQDCISRLGPYATLIEWDNNLPPVQTLLAEASKAREIVSRYYDAA